MKKENKKQITYRVMDISNAITLDVEPGDKFESLRSLREALRRENASYGFIKLGISLPGHPGVFHEFEPMGFSKVRAGYIGKLLRAEAQLSRDLDADLEDYAEIVDRLAARVESEAK